MWRGFVVGRKKIRAKHHADSELVVGLGMHVLGGPDRQRRVVRLGMNDLVPWSIAPPTNDLLLPFFLAMFSHVVFCTFLSTICLPILFYNFLPIFLPVCLPANIFPIFTYLFTCMFTILLRMCYLSFLPVALPIFLRICLPVFFAYFLPVVLRSFYRCVT